MSRAAGKRARFFPDSVGLPLDLRQMSLEEESRLTAGAPPAPPLCLPGPHSGAMRGGQARGGRQVWLAQAGWVCGQQALRSVGRTGASLRPQHGTLRPLATLQPHPDGFLGCLEASFLLHLGPGPGRWEQPRGPGLEAEETAVEVACAKQPLSACLGLSLHPGDPIQAQDTRLQRN